MTDRFAALHTVGSGSYAPADVHFLLRHMRLDATDVEEKERLIQSGQRHYSEMISAEQAPDAVHSALYQQALTQNGRRMAADVQALAEGLHQACDGEPIALVSFVRAGLPLGVLLRRALVEKGREAHHYGVSIIRDRGIDRVALRAIVEAHGARNIVFVDGWTGKGAISGELARTLRDEPGFEHPPRLVVLADPCGQAWLAASAEDWIIPSGILGATVSGLVSRSIWPAEGGLHGCVRYDHLHPHDVTRSFIEHIEIERATLGPVAAAQPWGDARKAELQAAARAVVERLASLHGIGNYNRIKPGIAEATRAVLRRVPERVLVRDRRDPDVQLLMHLTERASVVVEDAGDALGPYRAVTIIRGIGQ